MAGARRRRKTGAMPRPIPGHPSPKKSIQGAVRISPAQRRFASALSETHKRFRRAPRAQVRFFSSVEELRKMLPENSFLRRKLESKAFHPAFNNPSDAYAIRVYKHGKLQSFMVFVGENAPEQETRKLCEEIVLGEEWERRRIKTASKVES